jgi:hypothetical protein
MTDEEKPQIDMELVRKSAAIRADTFHAIGEFITGFSQLEFTLRFALAAYLNLPDGYFNAVTGPYDFRMLCAVTFKVGSIRYPELAEQIDKVFKECLSLNDKRNHIAHGLWNEGLGDDWSVRVLNRNTLETTYVPYSTDELYALAARAQELMQRVIGFGQTPTRSGGDDQP